MSDQDLIQRTEEDLSWAGLAVAETIRAAELAVFAIGALLICPPLAILAVVVIVPAVALAVAVGAVAAVVSLPIFAVRHLHRHRAGAAHARVHRLAQWGRSDPAGSRAQRLVAKLHRTPAPR
jgi:hypothetical protein